MLRREEFRLIGPRFVRPGVVALAAGVLIYGPAARAQEPETPTPTPTPPPVVDGPGTVDYPVFIYDGLPVHVGDTLTVLAFNLDFCVGQEVELGLFGGSGPDLFAPALVDGEGSAVAELLTVAEGGPKPIGARGDCVPDGLVVSEDTTVTILQAQTPTPRAPVVGTGGSSGGTAGGWLAVLAGAAIAAGSGALVGIRLRRRGG